MSNVNPYEYFHKKEKYQPHQTDIKATIVLICFFYSLPFILALFGILFQ